MAALPRAMMRPEKSIPAFGVFHAWLQAFMDASWALGAQYFLEFSKYTDTYDTVY